MVHVKINVTNSVILVPKFYIAYEKYFLDQVNLFLRKYVQHFISIMFRMYHMKYIGEHKKLKHLH